MAGAGRPAGRSWWSRWWKRLAIIVGVLVLLFIGGSALAAKFTENNKFCGTDCHEMWPYRDTWLSRPTNRSTGVKCLAHCAGTDQLHQDQDGCLTRSLGALHRRLEEADPGDAAHPQRGLRAFRLPHQRPDEQDDLARPAGAGQVPARQRRPRQAALHLVSFIAGACRRARGHRPAGPIDAVVLHLPHRRHRELQLLPQASARRTAVRARDCHRRHGWTGGKGGGPHPGGPSTGKMGRSRATRVTPRVRR